MEIKSNANTEPDEFPEMPHIPDTPDAIVNGTATPAEIEEWNRVKTKVDEQLGLFVRALENSIIEEKHGKNSEAWTFASALMRNDLSDLSNILAAGYQVDNLLPDGDSWLTAVGTPWGLEYLLSLGRLDPNAKIKTLVDGELIDCGETALVRWTTKANSDMVELLLRHGADPFLSYKGHFPCDLANRKMLIELGWTAKSLRVYNDEDFLKCENLLRSAMTKLELHKTLTEKVDHSIDDGKKSGRL